MSVVKVFVLFISTSYFAEAFQTQIDRRIIDYKLKFLNQTIDVLLDDNDRKFVREFYNEFQHFLENIELLEVNGNFLIRSENSSSDDISQSTVNYKSFRRSLEDSINDVLNGANNGSQNRRPKKILRKFFRILGKLIAWATPTTTTSSPPTTTTTSSPTTTSPTIPTTTTPPPPPRALKKLKLKK